MADTIGNQSSHLEQNLLERPDRFSFFQALRLLKRFSAARKWPEESVHVQPSLTFEYPGSEIVEANVDEEKQRYNVLASFLGLYGSSSPLPSFYSDDLIDAELDGDDSTKSLFDIFNQRLYELLFQASKKYRLLYSVEDKSGIGHDFLYNLLGINQKDISRGIPNTTRFLRYIDIFNRHPHSALGLKTILEDALEGLQVDIQQCVPRNVKIPAEQRLKVGKQGNQLGVNAVLGHEVLDHSGKIIISIGPLTGGQFHDLLNNTKKWMTLSFLIQAYLTVPLSCDLKLILAENEAKHPQLGVPNWSSLGKDAWLFSGDQCRSIAAILPFDYTEDAKHSSKRPELFLNRIKLFRDFSEEVRSKLAKRLQHHHFMPNETIFNAGDEADSMYIIVEGLIGIWISQESGKAVEVARLGTGNIFGEMALLNNKPRNATAVSISSSYMFVLMKDDLEPIIAGYPEVGEKLQEIATSRESGSSIPKGKS
jgi:type VI secretion system protein ImpH